ncbi:hypothetical protein LCGC14_0777600 [marine sediment metagenome]|uniref:Uncharacterized protein n=1 Tax=marine sediment metagenome TaxID=412755 RepID=A0A0F9PWQ4_9ZZZZ
MTHTYVELEVSAAVFDEIRGRMLAAGYDHVFSEGRAIDMHGIALIRGKRKTQGQRLVDFVRDGGRHPNY